MTLCKFDSKGLKPHEKHIPVNTCYLLLFLQWLFGPFSGHGFLTYMSVSQISHSARDILNYLYWKPEHSHCCFSSHIQQNIPVLVPALLPITLILSGNGKINLGCQMLETVLLCFWLRTLLVWFIWRNLSYFLQNLLHSWKVYFAYKIRGMWCNEIQMWIFIFLLSQWWYWNTLNKSC